MSDHQSRAGVEGGGHIGFDPARARGIKATVGNLGSSLSWQAMLWLWLIYAMNANMRTWIQTVQPALVEEFRISPSRLGLFSGVLTILLGVAALPVSVWSDKGGHGWKRKYRHLPVVAVYLVFSLLTGVNIVTVSIGAIFAIQAVKSLASGGGEAVEVTTIAEWWPLERRGFAQGLHHTAFPWGTLLGGLGVAGMYALFGSQNWRYVFVILPLLVVPFYFFYWRFANATNYQRFIADTERRGLTPPLGSENESEQLKAAPGAVRRTFRNPNVMICSLSSGLANIGYMGISFWLPLYLAFVAHYPLAEVAALSVLFTITGGVGQILWGFVSDRFGRKYTLVLLFSWIGVGFVLFQFVGINLLTLVVVQLFTGLAINGVYPVLYAMTSDSSEPGAIAIGNGLNMSGMLVGGFGAIIMGALISLGGGYSSTSGFLYGLYFIAAVMFITALLILFFTRETIGRMYARDWALVTRESCLKGRQIEN